MILKFDFEKRMNEIHEKVQKHEHELVETNYRELEKFRRSSLNKIDTPDGLKKLMIDIGYKEIFTNAQLEEQLFMFKVELFGSLCMESIKYLSSILVEKLDRSVRGPEIMAFMDQYCENEMEEHFSTYWYKFRNKWVHENKLYQDKNLIQRYFVNGINIDRVMEVMSKVFKRIQIDYPGRDMSKIDVNWIPDYE